MRTIWIDALYGLKQKKTQQTLHQGHFKSQFASI